jgi:hypothetical protein
MRVINVIPLGCSLLSPVSTVICVQTLKALPALHPTEYAFVASQLVQAISSPLHQDLFRLRKGCRLLADGAPCKAYLQDLADGKAPAAATTTPAAVKQMMDRLIAEAGVQAKSKARGTTKQIGAKAQGKGKGNVAGEGGEDVPLMDEHSPLFHMGCTVATLRLLAVAVRRNEAAARELFKGGAADLALFAKLMADGPTQQACVGTFNAAAGSPFVRRLAATEAAAPLVSALLAIVGDASARCAFFDRNLHSRMPLDPTHVRLKLLHVCDQWHSSRVSTPLTD